MQTQEAIVLKVTPYSDSSSIATVFFSTYGICDVITSSSKQSLSPLLKVEMSFTPSQKSLWRVGKVHIQKSFSNSAKSYEHIQRAFLIKEFILKAIPKNAPASKYYGLFCSFLENLKNSSYVDAATCSFLIEWCKLEGITCEPLVHIKTSFEKLFRYVCEYEGIKMNAKEGT